MFNIVYYTPILDDKTNMSASYSLYMDLYNNNLLLSPKLYTDKNTIFIQESVPVFSTFYIRNYFTNNYILVDFMNLSSIPKYLHHKCIVLYNKLFHNIDNITSYLNIEYDEDAIHLLKEKLSNEIL